jgi:hypothetical protein
MIGIVLISILDKFIKRILISFSQLLFSTFFVLVIDNKISLVKLLNEHWVLLLHRNRLITIIEILSVLELKHLLVSFVGFSNSLVLVGPDHVDSKN